MNIREIARKMGGDEAVADIDAGLAMQAEVEKEVNACVDAFLAKHMEGADDKRRNLVLTSLAEAFSVMFAQRGVAAMSALGYPFGQVVISSINSLHHNLHKARDDHEAQRGGVADLIKEAATKGASK